MKEYHLALAGNPNSGKTSIFNQLTGSNQSVGNWPGVTVERKSGYLRKNRSVVLQDLPGVYSLSPYTPEELVARDYLINQQPDAIVNVVDGTNLERNLYLTTQLLELGIPVVIGLNMMDLVKKQGLKLDLSKLAYALNAEVVGISALKKQGLPQVVEAALKKAAVFPPKQPHPFYDDRVEAALNEIIEVLGNTVLPRRIRFTAIKLFERDERLQQQLNLSPIQQTEIEEIITITEKIFGDTSDAIMINERYGLIEEIMALCAAPTADFSINLSDKIDRVVTQRYLALPIFALIMWGIYYLSIQNVGTIGTDWVNDVLFGDWIPNVVQYTLHQWQVAEWLQRLILDGIIAGVGAVLGFLPQIVVLFFCLSLLEDCGYMSRIAFVMDRLFRKFGLSGKSFIPMLIATGCGVPGVMASRTIENEKDRRLTVMLTTFMPCSAKLPIIALIAGAFFPQSSWVAPSAYFIGMAAIVLSGIALKKTVFFSGDPAPFIMELPAYHIPQLKNVVKQTADRGIAFVKKAGTIIFVACLGIWFLSSYNLLFQQVPEDQSILAGIGKLIAPIFAPLGWGNWQGAVATITGLIAKENVIGTFGVLYGKVGEISENGHEIWGMMHADYTAAAAYSFLVFNLLCAPCFAAIGAIHREMGDRKWTWFAILYQCGLAYGVSLIVYQIGHVLFEAGQLTVSFYAALFLSGLMITALLRKPKPDAPANQLVREVK